MHLRNNKNNKKSAIIGLATGKVTDLWVPALLQDMGAWQLPMWSGAMSVKVYKRNGEE